MTDDRLLDHDEDKLRVLMNEWCCGHDAQRDACMHDEDATSSVALEYAEHYAQKRERAAVLRLLRAMASSEDEETGDTGLTVFDAGLAEGADGSTSIGWAHDPSEGYEVGGASLLRHVGCGDLAESDHPNA